MKYYFLILVSAGLVSIIGCGKKNECTGNATSCKQVVQNTDAWQPRTNSRKLVISDSLQNYMVFQNADPDAICITVASLADGSQVVDVGVNVCPANQTSQDRSAVVLSLKVGLSGDLFDTRATPVSTGAVGRVDLAALQIPSICRDVPYSTRCQIKLSTAADGVAGKILDIIAP